MKIESCSKGRYRIGSCFRRSVHHQEALKFDDELHVFLVGMPFFQIEGKISLEYFKQNEITYILFQYSQSVKYSTRLFLLLLLFRELFGNWHFY